MFLVQHKNEPSAFRLMKLPSVPNKNSQPHSETQISQLPSEISPRALSAPSIRNLIDTFQQTIPGGSRSLHTSFELLFRSHNVEQPRATTKFSSNIHPRSRSLFLVFKRRHTRQVKSQYRGVKFPIGAMWVFAGIKFVASSSNTLKCFLCVRYSNFERPSLCDKLRWLRRNKNE